MSNIEARLKDIFEKHNIVFWYDDEGKLKDEFEALDLDVKKLYINNNEFGIKYEILTSKKGSKFLVYSDKKEPQDRDNWLIDLVLKGYKFSANRASMILNDLGLDIIYKPFIEEHLEFFRAKKRVEPFAKLLEKNEDDNTLALKMIATLLKCDESIEAIVIKLLSNFDEYESIVKYKLDRYLWKNIEEKYNYSSKEPTLKDFAYKLLLNHFYFFVDKSKCSLNKEAFLFIKSWMDSNSFNSSFKELSNRVEKELNFGQIVDSYSLDSMIECDTFEVCEQFVVSNLLEMLLAQEIDKEKIVKIFKAREHSFWFSKYSNIYWAIVSATNLIDVIKNSNIRIDGFKEGFEKYVNEYYKIDTIYRKYIVFANSSEHINLLKKLNEKIENLYLNGYLRVINDTWQGFVKEYGKEGLKYQRDFYKSVVLPTVQKGQKAFVIISDALRYECGVELKEKIVSLNRFDAKIEPLVGVLPSFTQLGVASLLPNESLSFKGEKDTVYVDGISSKGSKNRDKILKMANERSVYIDSESFLNLNRQEGRAFVKEHEVIYIYHNEIDATGDKKESEHKVFESVEDSFKSIERLIKQIANFNGTNIFITADHGFLYQNTQTKESEFCKVPKYKDAKRFNRRFIIANSIEPHNCIDIYKASNFGIDGNELIALAKSINKIRLQGGGHRFVHGGASLQEMVVPLISIKKRRKDDVRKVEVSAILPSLITTNSVIISFYQEEPIIQKIKPRKLKIAFYAKDDTLLSNSNSFNFNSEDSYDRNREVKLKFDFKQNAHNYSNQDIKLVLKEVIKGSSEEPIYKEYNIKLKLSIVNDFDDF